MTTRFVVLLCALLMTATSTLRAQDYRYATSSVRVRADASTHSRVVMTLARGARVEVRACAVAWCWVEYRGRTGYVSENYLARVPQIVKRPNSGGYVNALGNFVSAPVRSTDGPPAGATARCRDGTYSFSQSRSGTCSSHGGVARWL
ncbi:MAG TPA: DUF3761 domain-containing protein [Longimicrobiales bacterium]